MALPEGERFTAASEDHRFATLALAFFLLSPQAADISSHNALELAGLSLAVGSQLDSERYSVCLLFDLAERAWARIAKERARCGAVDDAVLALVVAVLAARQGTGDPLEEAHLLECAATVRRGQGWESEARRLRSRARGIYLRVGDPWAAEALEAVSTARHEDGSAIGASVADPPGDRFGKVG